MDILSNTTWAKLQAELDALQALLPRLRTEHPEEGDCLVAFAGIADEILWRARHDADVEHHVSIALTDMLVDAGSVPADHRQH